MAWKAGLCGATLLLLTAAGAQAGEADTIAERAGFLIGHAQRCGVSDARLQRAAVLGKKLIAAFAVDADDRKEAQAQFARQILASALAAALGEPLPPCSLIKAQLTELEQHRPAAATSKQEGSPMADKDRPEAPPARAGRNSAAATAKPRRSVTTTSEELAPERRAELELQRAARQTRGRPPSI